jgi:uncharacterized protein DUF4440
MKSMVPLAVLLGLTTVFTMPRQAANVEQTLLQLERDWEQANAKNDTAALERILAPEFVSTDSDGRLVTRAENVCATKVRCSEIY